MQQQTSQWVIDGAFNLYTRNSFVKILRTMILIVIVYSVITTTAAWFVVGKLNEIWAGIVVLAMLVFGFTSVPLFKLYMKFLKNKFGNSKKWQEKYLQTVIDEHNDFWKKKDGLIHDIKMKAIDNEEQIWVKARNLQNHSRKAQMLLLELEK